MNKTGAMLSRQFACTIKIHSKIIPFIRFLKFESVLLNLTDSKSTEEKRPKTTPNKITVPYILTKHR